MFIDPTTITWLLLAAASACAFMIGKTYSHSSKEDVIETTILWMIDNNFVKGHKNTDGEWELEDLDGKK
jgi:hypothetical protein